MKITNVIRRMAMETAYAELVRDYVLAHDRLRQYELNQAAMRRGDPPLRPAQLVKGAIVRNAQ